MSTTSALPTWHAASPQGRLCHVPIFQLPTLDPTHLWISHLESASRPFASKRPLLAPPWRNHGSSQKKLPHTGLRARYAQSDFDRESCSPALYASFVWYASLRLYKPRGMHSLMRSYGTLRLRYDSQTTMPYALTRIRGSDVPARCKTIPYLPT